MHATITAYKGRLIFNLITRKSVKNELITNLDNKNIPGHIIINTKKNLGISHEALTLLKQINKVKHDDDEGRINWEKSYQGLDSFTWFGMPSDIRKPEDLLGAKTYKIMNYMHIENDVPEGARQAIDKLLKQFKDCLDNE